jgi:RNA polymerase sigma-70 factor, ECF subfamily
MRQRAQVSTPAEPDYKGEFLALLPSLRAFARSLCGNPAWADDLTQETLLRAWANRASFEPGTNMRGWLFTILRNTFYTSARRRRREAEDPDGAHAMRLLIAPAQEHSVELRDLRRCMGRLPDEQREALILVGASGFTYKQAAEICGCAVGSIKSRVSRARRALVTQLEGPDEHGEGQETEIEERFAAEGEADFADLAR